MFFSLLTLLSALALAAVAGWFSIVGIMSIYAGAPLYSALVMGAVLEASKLVTISWLYRNWGYSGWFLKIPLTYFTIALMVVTSIGSYGFLTKGHLQQGAATIDNSAKVVRLDQQIAREQSVISDNETIITQLDTAVNSYIGKDKTDKAVSIRKSQDPQRKQLRSDISNSQKQIDEYNDEKLKLQSEVRSLQLDVGPIKYIAGLFYSDDTGDDKKIELAVKWFTLLIVSTLDPLAVILLIAANHTILRVKNEKEEIGQNAQTNTAGPTTTIRYPTNRYPTNGNEDNEISDPEKNTGNNTGEERAPWPSLETNVDLPDSAPPLVDEKTEIYTQVHATIYEDISDSLTNEETYSSVESNEIVQETTPIHEEVIEENNKDRTDNRQVDAEDHGRSIAKDFGQASQTDIVEPKPIPWIQQSGVLSGIVGQTQHFIPQQINNNQTQDSSPSPENNDKYSKSLSWLKEFTKG